MSGASKTESVYRLVLDDTTATDRLAATLAGIARRGDVIALEGDLGTGKTAFARAFIRAVGARSGEDPGDVPSPTFTLVQIYDFAPATVYHFDLYRLADPEEALELGMEDAFVDGISLIEWPERLAGRLPDERLDVRLEYGDAPDARIATLAGSGAWRERLAGLLGSDAA